MRPTADKLDLDDVQRGLRAGEFFLEYVPVVSLESNRCIGAEAVVGWQRRAGVLRADELLPLIDNTPASGPVTYWVLEQLASELGAWLRVNHDVHVSITVPVEILGRGGLAYSAQKSGLMDVAHKIVLEISAHSVPDKLAVEALKLMPDLKVHVALKDVGPTDSNMLLFSQAKVEIIKLDRTFVAGMLGPDWSIRRLEGLAALIRATPGLQIVAEGIESVLQIQLLKAAGITMAQGPFFSPPLSVTDFKAFRKSHP